MTRDRIGRPADAATSFDYEIPHYLEVGLRSYVQNDDLAVYVSMADAQPRDRHRQAESTRPGAAGIDEQDAVALLDARLMRVPGDDRGNADGPRIGL